MRAVAGALGVSVGVIQRLLKEKTVVRHTNTIKPLLSEANKSSRVCYALSQIDPDTLQFQDMYNVIHIDENWFNEDVDKRSYYLVAGENPPQRQRQSKRFIGKTMFLAAVARPR